MFINLFYSTSKSNPLIIFLFQAALGARLAAGTVQEYMRRALWGRPAPPAASPSTTTAEVTGAPNMPAPDVSPLSSVNPFDRSGATTAPGVAGTAAAATAATTTSSGQATVSPHATTVGSPAVVASVPELVSAVATTVIHSPFFTPSNAEILASGNQFCECVFVLVCVCVCVSLLFLYIFPPIFLSFL
jgi:hypothetical protein